MNTPSNPPIDALPLICAVQDNLARRLVRQPELVSLAQSHGFSWEATDRLARASWLLLRRIDQGFAQVESLKASSARFGSVWRCLGQHG